jgi:hypothetical protein
LQTPYLSIYALLPANDMASTTHPEFNAQTENVEVAGTFANEIRGKTIIVTGVNKGGIGFTRAQGFVRKDVSTSRIHLQTDWSNRLPTLQLCWSSPVGTHPKSTNASTHLKQTTPISNIGALKLNLGDKD